MTIIALVSDAYCNSKELAKSVARKMEYSYIAEGIIPAASKMYDILEANLRHALKSGSSFLDRFTSKKQKYIPYLFCINQKRIGSDYHRVLLDQKVDFHHNKHPLSELEIAHPSQILDLKYFLRLDH